MKQKFEENISENNEAFLVLMTINKYQTSAKEDIMEKATLENDNTNLTFDLLVEKYKASLYRFCRTLTYTKEDAEDLFQETFIKAFEQFDKIRTSSNHQNYLFAIAVFQWKSLKRKVARRNRIATIQPYQSEEIENIAALQPELEDEMIVREVVMSLPEKFKVPIVMYFNMELTTKEISGILKVPVGTVHSRLHKGKKMIKERLGEIQYER